MQVAVTAASFNTLLATFTVPPAVQSVGAFSVLPHMGWTQWVIIIISQWVNVDSRQREDSLFAPNTDVFQGFCPTPFMRPPGDKEQELHSLEKVATEARNEGDLALAAVLICIKRQRLFICVGYNTFGDYIDARVALYGFRRRQAERLISGHRTLQLLSSLCPPPTHERQASQAVSVQASQLDVTA